MIEVSLTGISVGVGCIEIPSSAGIIFLELVLLTLKETLKDTKKIKK
jgi:hypothetical protein